MSLGGAEVCIDMTEETVSVSATVNAPAHAVFAVLADPTTHRRSTAPAGCASRCDGKPLTEAGQIFRMGMHHDNHPDKALRDGEPGRGVRPAARHRVATRQGPDERGNLSGRRRARLRRMDLALRPRARSANDRTEVTLTYDWSGVRPDMREISSSRRSTWQHLDNSLKHLAELVEPR